MSRAPRQCQDCKTATHQGGDKKSAKNGLGVIPSRKSSSRIRDFVTCIRSGANQIMDSERARSPEIDMPTGCKPVMVSPFRMPVIAVIRVKAKTVRRVNLL